MASLRASGLIRALRCRVLLERVAVLSTEHAGCGACRAASSVARVAAAPAMPTDSRSEPCFSQSWRGFAKQAKKAKSDEEVPDVNIGTLRPAVKELATTQMDAALDALSRELSKLRTGRASPGMLDHVLVDASGFKSPLSHVAAVSVSDAQTLTVMPYDPSTVKSVESAVLSSPLRLNPVVNGQTLTVPIPKLTKEHCDAMCKMAGKAGEVAKLSLRRARKDALDKISAAKKDMPKDDAKRLEKEVEELTKKYAKSIDDACKTKEREILAG